MVDGYIQSSLWLGFIFFVIIYVGMRLLSRGSATSKNFPPGPRGVPLLGVIPLALCAKLFSKLNGVELMTAWGKKYGSTLMFKVFNTRIVLLSGYDVMREAFRDPDINDRPTMVLFEMAIGRPNCGIVFSNGKTWREHRRIAGHVLRESYFEDVATKEGLRLVFNFQRMEGRQFDASDHIYTVVGNTMASIILGTTYEHGDKDLQHLVSLSHHMAELSGPGGFLTLVPVLAKLPLPGHRLSMKYLTEITDFIAKEIEKHRASFDPEVPPTNFIDWYLHDLVNESSTGTSTFDEKNLRCTVLDLLLAGWDTTYATLQWALLYLITFPEVQERVQSEIDQVVGRSRPPNLSDEANLPYTEAFLLETERFAMPVPFGMPHLVRQDAKIGDYDIPKGAIVVGNGYGLSRDPSIWGDPETFRPERFLGDDGMLDRKPELVTFGVGRRACLGEKQAKIETFIFVTNILQNFTLKRPDGIPKSDIRGTFSVTHLAPPYKLVAIKR